MDLFRLRYLFKLTKNRDQGGQSQSGQSTVEYILLFAVVAALVTTVIKSDSFQGVFGENGTFGSVYKRELEFSYRHGLGGRTPFATPNYKDPKEHDTYNKKFFASRAVYGGE